MMETKHETAATLQIPFHRLEVAGNEVLIRKSKAIANRWVFVRALVIALFTVVTYTQLKQSPNAFKKPVDSQGVLFLTAAGLFLAINLFLSIKRFTRLISNFRLTKCNGLLLNGKRIVCPERPGKTMIVVQDASESIGESFTIGISVGRKFFGLCYNLDHLSANKVAAFLSGHLGYDVKHREAAFFPLFNGH